jgi:hypothetical protein
VRFQLDFDSGGPGGRGGWILIALALIVATVIIVRILVENAPSP